MVAVMFLNIASLESTTKKLFSVSLRIQSESGKIPTRKTLNMDTFQAVLGVTEQCHATYDALLKITGFFFTLVICEIDVLEYHFVAYTDHKPLINLRKDFDDLVSSKNK